jgi:hypothetical protein
VTTCAVPGRTHQADIGIGLCTKHFDDLADWLHDVEREHAALDATPSLAANWGSSRGGTLASHTTPARINPLVHNDPRRVPLAELTGPAGADDTLSAFDVLHTWAEEIRTGRSITRPGRWTVDRIPGRYGPFHDQCAHVSCGLLAWRHYVTDPLTVTTERQLLSRHLEWAATQPWIGALWAQVRALRAQLQAVNGTGNLRVGSCPQCSGRLSIIEPRYSSGPAVGADHQWAAECDQNVLHRWEGKQLIRLRLELDEKHRGAK